jgi:phosphatidylserine decarboxylase
MGIRPEVVPFLIFAAGAGAALDALLRLLRARRWAAPAGVLTAALIGVYMLWFFRDPERTPPPDERHIVAGADGVVAAVSRVREQRFLHRDCIRISIFLSLFDVHVNRAPIGGTARFLGYYPGRRLFTFDEKSSDENQHNAIRIEGRGTTCLVYQIVGPVCRRVVYWPPADRPAELRRGERIGMMKFGSRLDMYFPAEDIEVLARVGDRVRAGETAVARLTAPEGSP